MMRGEIYYVKNNKLEDGCKPCPDRPALIVSSDMLNTLCNTVQVCYLTTNPYQDMATHVTTRSMGGNTPSTILCEQIYTVNKMRLGQLAGELTEGELRNVDVALAISMGLDFETSAQEPREIVKTVEVEKVVMREPTEEELDKLLDARAEKRFHEAMEEMRRTPAQIQPLPVDPAIVKAETERDVYRRMYEDMLDRLTAIAAGVKA